MRTRSRRNTENRRIKSELIIYRCNLSCELEFDDELAVQPSRHCVLDLWLRQFNWLGETLSKIRLWKWRQLINHRWCCFSQGINPKKKSFWMRFDGCKNSLVSTRPKIYRDRMGHMDGLGFLGFSVVDSKKQNVWFFLFYFFYLQIPPSKSCWKIYLKKVFHLRVY